MNNAAAADESASPPQLGDRQFAITVAVDYADTDAGGVVYYANYLAYTERARNAWLRQLGYPLTDLARRHRVLFTVTEANLQYRAPGRLDDALEITLGVAKLQRASLRFRHQIRRGDAVLVDAQVRLGLVNSDTFKPQRMPAELTDAIVRWSRGEAETAAGAAA